MEKKPAKKPAKKTTKKKKPRKRTSSNMLMENIPQEEHEKLREKIKQEDKKKNRGGQPTKYREEYCEQIIEHMGTGLSFESFAGEIGVSFETLYEWCRRHEKFSEAKKIGLAANLRYMERISRQATLGGIKGFIPPLWIFTMKNRFGWQDRTKVVAEMSGDAKKARLTEQEIEFLVEAEIEKRQQKAIRIIKGREIDSGQEESN